MLELIENARKSLSQLMADFEEARIDLARWIAKANTTITLIEVGGIDQQEEQEALIGEITNFGLGNLVVEGDFRATVTAVTDFAKNVSAGNDEARTEFMTMFTPENIVNEFKVIRCPNCGEVLTKSDCHCHSCGMAVTPLEEYVVIEGTPQIKCCCGRWHDAEYKFCPSCGKRNTLTASDDAHAPSSTVGAIVSSK
jgi:rRNA maturation endonuclease Nob1